MATPTLLNLPPELKVLILTALPIRKMIQMRAMCQELKALIDKPENQRAVLRTLQTTALGRIRDSIKNGILFNSETDFLHALAAYLGSRGITITGLHDVPGFEPTIDDLQPFAERYVESKFGEELEGQSTVDKELLVSAAKRLACSLVERHLAAHLAETEYHSYPVPPESDLVEIDIEAKILALEETWLAEAIQKVEDREQALLKGVEYVFKDELLGMGPEFVIGRLERTFDFDVVQPLVEEAPGGVTMKELQEELLLPELPEKRSYALCVRSRWAFNFVRGGLRGRTALQKAAVLEELWLY